MDRKELVTILSTDMSKAFDSLSHSLILTKLDAYGFNSGSLELIRSFFDSRLNGVKINGHISEWRIMERACPQGSSFGPLLWNMFQNDLSRYIGSLLIHLCMLMIIKYRLMTMIYKRPPKLSGDKQKQCHNGTRRTYCKLTLRNTRSLPLIRSLPRRPLGMH